MTKRESSISIIWYFFKGYKLQVAVLCILSLITGALEALTVAAVYPILTSAFAVGSGQDDFILRSFREISRVLPIDDAFIAYSLVFIIIAFIAFGVKYISIRQRIGFSARLIAENQNRVFDKFITADYQFFTRHKQGEIVYNVTTAPQRLSNLVISATEIISQVILCISVAVILFSLSWQGALVVVAIAILYQQTTRFIGGKVSYYAAKGEMMEARQNNIILNEAVSGIWQVKVFDNIHEWIRRFSQAVRSRWSYFAKHVIWHQIPGPALMLIIYLLVGLAAIFIKIAFPGSYVELIPVFGTFAFAVFRMIPIVGSISSSAIQVMGALPDCEAVYHTLHQDIRQIIDGKKELKSFESAVAFDNVTFTYNGSARVLDAASFSFEKGKTTAIVGRSGSGKTTIINLILRLFDAESGVVRIDGTDIRELRISSWLSRVGVVSQDTFIFNDTVRNNICFFTEKSDEEVYQAARYADAHRFIMELPDGYDTYVGDRGMKLSGGQRQRIAVARAIIRNPDVFIFDEATNALDNISEKAVQRAIDQLSRENTVIIIAHRLSTIVNADKIIVLENGKVREEGTHRELIEKGGTYNELYRSSFV